MEETPITKPEETYPEIIDEAMLNFAAFFVQMTEVDGYIADAEMQTACRIEKLELSMPVQLDLHVMDDGSVRLGGSPPLYYTETTVMPVFHQLRIHVELDKQESNRLPYHEQAVESGIIY